MPWQLVSSQGGLRGLQERRTSQAERPKGASLGPEPPRVAGGASRGSGAHRALLAAGDEARSSSLIGPRRPVPLAISVPRPREPYRSSPLTPQPSPEPPV